MQNFATGVNFAGLESSIQIEMRKNVWWDLFVYFLQQDASGSRSSLNLVNTQANTDENLVEA